MVTKTRPILRSCVAILLSMLLLGSSFYSIQAAPVQAAPGINVSPSSSIPGSAVTISGSGFEPGGYQGTVQWDGASQSTFSIPGGGVFSVGFTIPSGASAGAHVISVCAACGDGDVEQKSSTNFTVTDPVSPVVPDVPVPPIVPVAPRGPVNPLPPGVPLMPSIPGVCTQFDLGADARVLNFDTLAPGELLASVPVGGTTARFVPGTAIVGIPPIAAHSGSQAIRSSYDDFGSGGHPIIFSFPYGVGAVGLYVGRETPGVNDQETIFAVLTAFGFDASQRVVEIASDQVPLPAEATPIQRCVVVRAPEGQGIRSLTLDYVTANGLSAYDPRWVDDITFAGGVTLADAPPIVEILYPAEGSTATSDSVFILAHVHEDIRLDTVEYTLNNTDFVPMTFARVAGTDPTLYEARGTIPAASLRSDIPNALRVRATDIYQRGEDSVSFSYAPAGAGDIWITGIEVTQSIQTLDNRIPLIGSKTTAVRVYVRSTEDARGPWSGVMARMTINGRTYSPSLVDPRVGIPVSPAGSDRKTTNDSFVFLLHPGDTVQGSRELQVSIYSIRGRPESTTANNTRTQAVTFNPPVYLSIYGVVYQNLNPTLGPAPWSDFEPHRLFSNTLLPLTDLTILHLPGIPAPSFDNSTGSAYITARDVWAPRIMASLPAGSRIYLLQPEAISIGGQTYPSGVINGQNNHGSNTGVVMAHELGHSLGLWWHVPGADASDPNYDYPFGGANIGSQVGFDTRTQRPVYGGPGQLYDIMAYGVPSWISPYTYCALLAILPAGTACPTGVQRAAAPQADPLVALAPSLDPFPRAMVSYARYDTSFRPQLQEDAYLFVAGQFNPDGTAEFFPFEVFHSSRELRELPGGTGYRMAFLDGSGNELASYDFQPLGMDVKADESLAFSLVVPFDPAMKQVILYQGGTLLAERNASPNAPQVTLLSPNHGENWTGMQTITWQAADLDGDPLTYTVEYSPDGGQTWTPLNTGLTTPSLRVDFDTVPGSNNALVRVSASDGMNTTSDASDGTFGVPFKGPQVSIDKPAEGANHLESVPFLLSATAFDWEDGAINNPGSFAWSSNLDGWLGAGPWIVLSSLTPGEHTLTVTVIDSTGSQASASVIVTIEALAADPSAPAPAPNAFHLPAWVWVVAGVILALLFIVAGLGLRRARK
jgi:hypothetical protein